MDAAASKAGRGGRKGAISVPAAGNFTLNLTAPFWFSPLMSTPPDTPLPPAKPAFIIGITGNVDPVGYADDRTQEGSEIETLRKKIRAIFEWARAQPESGWLDPATGEFRRGEKCPPDTAETWNSCWQPLGLADSPIILLSSLAPGIDTIAAEEALAAGITVRAPLPFPLQDGIYPRCSSFCAKGSATPDPAKVQRLQDLLARIRQQPGGVEERDLFEVGLDKEWRGPAGIAPETTAENDLTANDPVSGKPRRHLRYRAAGEYVAAYCHMLIGIHDPRDRGDAADLFDAGSVAIVDTMRRGLSWELLAVSNNFSWADNGPALHIPIEREKRRVPGQPGPGPFRLAMLHPYDARPDDCAGCPDHDPRWQREGDLIFRRMASLLAAFDAEPADSAKEEVEWFSMLLGSAATKGRKASELTAPAQQALTAEGFPFARALMPLATVRRRAGDIAGRLEETRKTLLWRLLVFIGLAAASVSAFEHWHSRAGHADLHDHPWIVPDSEGRVQAGLLLAALVLIFLTGRLYHRHLTGRVESRRHDARAIAEGLRVQFYWSLAGLGQSVSANYMQRQRNELSWIRYVISSLSFPYERAWHGFKKLSAPARHALLTVVHQHWVRGQRDYYKKKALQLGRKLHHCHLAGWACTGAGVLNILGMFLLELFLPLRAWFEAHFWRPSIGLALLGLLGLLAGRHLARRAAAAGHGSDQHEDEEVAVPPGFCRWLLGRFSTWGLACLGTAAILPLPLLLEALPVDFPGWADWWIILTGLCLLSGGLCLAWAERNFYAELSRQYRAMRHLYAAADRRLEKLLARLGTAPADTPAAARLQAEIQDILYNLGCEAQDENAEWLMLHRARPLEPFMAG